MRLLFSQTIGICQTVMPNDASVLARFLPQEEAEVKEDGNEDLKHVERMKSIAFQHLSISGSRLNRMHTDA
jgi:hypothetical protein